jgi:competence ComEA-like helix-hairpin-helix protein
MDEDEGGIVSAAEWTALLVVGGLFAFGLVVELVREDPSARSFDYAALDAMFAERAPNPSETETKNNNGSSVDSHSHNVDFTEHDSPQPTAFLDMNDAEIEELVELPGVGPVLAERIVARRDAIGGFTKPEDLLDVPGVGRKTFDKIRPYLYISTIK